MGNGIPKRLSSRQQTGGIPASVHAPRRLFKFQADPDSPAYNDALQPDQHIILYCGAGDRSALAAKTLLNMSYEEVSSLSGGYAPVRVARDK